MQTASIILKSMIFDDDQQRDPHFIYAKNNILIILACFTTYNIYYLFKDYQDAILLAVLAGVAYKELEKRFVAIWDRKTHDESNQKISIMRTLSYSILLFILPWIRNQSKHSFESIDFNISSVWSSFVLTTNPVVRVAQAYLFMYISIYFRQILYSLASKKLIQWFTFEIITNRTRTFFNIIFGIITAITVLLTIGTFAVVITTEFGRAYSLTKTSIEKFYNCQFELSSENSTIIPCGQMISGNISAYMPKIENQTEYNLCIISINSTEISYLGYDYFDYEDDICTFKQYVKHISPNLIQSFSLKQTGMLLRSIKNVLLTLINFFLDTSFSISTFFAIFMVVIYDTQSKARMNQLFGKSKENLVKDITNLVSATIVIALEHLALGIFVFELFRFTDINTILSFLLSIIAFIPLIKPSIIVIMIAALKIWLSGQYLTSIICAAIYWHFSGQIFQDSYKKVVSLNTVIINLSVIFGIYQYGVSGIFYGPLLILLFQCVRLELFQIKNH